MGPLAWGDLFQCDCGLGMVLTGPNLEAASQRQKRSKPVGLSMAQPMPVLGEHPPGRDVPQVFLPDVPRP